MQTAESIYSIAKLVATVGLAYGWTSPLFSQQAEFHVVDTTNKLIGSIKRGEFLGENRKIDKIRLAIMHLTRVAFIYRAMYKARIGK